MKEIVKLISNVDADGNDAEFGVKLRPVTTKMRIEFLQLNQKHINEADACDARTANLRKKQMETLHVLNTARLQVADPALPKNELNAKVKEIDRSIAQLETDLNTQGEELLQQRLKAVRLTAEYNVRYLQMLLDPRGLTNEHKALIASEPDSDFWTTQHEVEIEAAVARFRGAA